MELTSFGGLEYWFNGVLKKIYIVFNHYSKTNGIVNSE